MPQSNNKRKNAVQRANEAARQEKQRAQSRTPKSQARVKKQAQKKADSFNPLGGGFKEQLRNQSKATRGTSIVNTGVEDYMNTRNGITSSQKNTLQNIQRRYRRAAERNEEAAIKAEMKGDEQAAKEYRATAKAARIIGGGFQVSSLNKLGKNKEERQKIVQQKIKNEENSNNKRLPSKSYAADNQTRRDAMASTILKSGSDSILYAATKQLWQDAPAGERNASIIQGFRDMGYEDVNDLLDVMDILEDMGVEVLEPKDDEDFYRMMSRLGMAMIAAAQNKAGV